MVIVLAKLIRRWMTEWSMYPYVRPQQVISIQSNDVEEYVDSVGKVSFTIDGSKKISITGPGVVKELVLITDSNDYNVMLMKDRFVLFNHSFGELYNVSPFFKFLTVSDLGDKYVLSINDISFGDNITIVIESKRTINAELTYVIMHPVDRKPEINIS